MQVLVTPSTPAVYDAIRSLPKNDYYFNGPKQAWMVRFTSYETAKKKFLDLKNFTVEIEDLPPGVKKVSENLLRRTCNCYTAI